MRQRQTGWFYLLGLLPIVLVVAAKANGSQDCSAGAREPCQATTTATAPSIEGDHLRAMESSLLQIAQQHPNDFAAQQNVGEFYLAQHRLPEGIAYLEKAERLNPADYNTGYDLSLALLDSGNLVKAAAQLQHMIGRDETAELSNLLAEVYERSGDYKNAALKYHRAAELDPSEGNIFDLGSFLLQHPHYQGFLDDALAVFRYGAQKYSRSAKLAVGLGVALYAEGKYDDAVQVLCAAVDLDPTDPKPYQFLGNVSKVSPAFLPEIRNRLKGFASLYPDNGPASYYYAMSLWQQQNGAAGADLQMIEVLLKKAIRNDPKLYKAHFQLGVLYQDEGKYQEAIEELNRTITLRPDYNRAHYRLIILYNRTHQREMADKQLAIMKQIKKQDEEAEELEDNPEDAKASTTSRNSN